MYVFDQHLASNQSETSTQAMLKETEKSEHTCSGHLNDGALCRACNRKHDFIETNLDKLPYDRKLNNFMYYSFISITI